MFKTEVEFLAVLQPDQSRGLQPIAALSKKMLDAETGNPIREQELIAIIQHIEGKTTVVVVADGLSRRPDQLGLVITRSQLLRLSIFTDAPNHAQQRRPCSRTFTRFTAPIPSLVQNARSVAQTKPSSTSASSAPIRFRCRVDSCTII